VGVKMLEVNGTSGVLTVRSLSRKGSDMRSRLENIAEV